jgi:hypothetical protein
MPFPLTAGRAPAAPAATAATSCDIAAITGSPKRQDEANGYSPRTATEGRTVVKLVIAASRASAVSSSASRPPVARPFR